MGSLTPREIRDLGVQLPGNSCSCKLLLPPGEYKRGAILPFVELLIWSLVQKFNVLQDGDGLEDEEDDEEEEDYDDDDDDDDDDDVYSETGVSESARI